MTKAMEIYKACESALGEEIKVSGTITKREFVEDGWTYTFFFYKGELSKIEAYNHRELIEIYNR